jgi:hypothetical protein
VANLQVKGIDDGLYAALAARAAADNRSISQEVVTILKDFLARPGPSAREATEQFLSLCGTWAEDRSPAEVAAAIRKERRRGRRFRVKLDVPD